MTSFCEQYPAVFLIDSGATDNFISHDFVKKSGLEHLLHPDTGLVTFGNKSEEKSSYYMDVNVSLGDTYTSTIRVYTGIKSDKHDVILGKPWHYDEQPEVD